MVRFALASLLVSSAAVSVTASFDRYAHYSPTTQITDIAAIDLDQEIFNEELSDLRIENALYVYNDGGHSGSFAKLNLVSLGGAARAYPAGTIVSGEAENGDTVTGSFFEPFSWGASDIEATIEVFYDTQDKQVDYLNCQVGGLFKFGSANHVGCFAPNGTITIGSTDFSYFYDIRQDNQNALTLRNLSTNAATTMKDPSGNYYSEFQTFIDYYGNTDYGDRWVTSASKKAPTDFKSGRGNNDFSWFDKRPGQTEAMKKGAAYLNLWMEVVRELNEAVAECEVDSDSAEHSIDEAVAFYAGSLTAQGDGEPGILLNALAEVRAHQFRTAGHMGDKDSGDAAVNVKVFEEFKKIQDFVLAQDATLCAKAKESKDIIVNLMKVPLVQGVLRYAYETEFEYPANDDLIDQERMQAEGATFAAAVLPFVHQCGSREADVVHKSMQVGAKTKFYDVKNAIERTYSCMGITCEEVGGIWDKTNQVYKVMPCDGTFSSSSGVGGFGTFLGVTVGVVLAGWLVIRYRKGGRRRKNSMPQMMHTGNIAAVSEIS